jgi:hypothetical protein
MLFLVTKRGIVSLSVLYERVDLRVMYGSVTLQLSVTSLNIGMNAKEYSAVMTLNCKLTLLYLAITEQPPAVIIINL